MYILEVFNEEGNAAPDIYREFKSIREVKKWLRSHDFFFRDQDGEELYYDGTDGKFAVVEGV